jgi:3-oxoacyl-[acyl-carrier protein] reductase
MYKRNSLITGGARGIGRAIVEQLITRGDRVFVFDCIDSHNPEILKLQELGVAYFHVDIASLESIKNGYSQLFTILDTQNQSSQAHNTNLDLLVNNAGITKDNLALRMSETDWDMVLDVNLKGAFFCAQQALKRMIKQEKSYIVSISSVVGLSGNPGQANYAASKAGLIAVTKTLAQEYASRNVLVNAIAPGFIQTPMTDKLSEPIKQEIINRIALKRLGTPQDIAHCVDFLSSGKADYITGQVLEITGGMT